MKKFIEYLIQQRNPQFAFDTQLTSWVLVSFIWNICWGLLRGFKLLLCFKNPKMAILGKNVSFFNTPSIKFGKFMKLGDDVYISALGKDGVQIGDNFSLGSFSRIVISTSLHHLGEFIRIGNHVGIGEFAYLGGGGGLEIGDECIIGQYFSCHPENHHYSDYSKSIRWQGVNRKGIKIGKNCWIGSKVTILDGVEIGDGCIIAAGAVVTQSFPSNSIIGGVPAKIIKNRIAA
ncbi:acetyltransferase [bacterium 336/3]|nr:acetyltransferase [bacterium 336/3]